MPVMHMPWGCMAYFDSEQAGSPVLFLHGTGCDAADWRAAIDALPVPCRAIALDFRAHGGSDVPAAPFSLGDLAADALALLAALDLPGALLVGHSLGGMVALEVARRSAAVACLVLLEGWTSLCAARAFVEPRFYGQLGAEAVARIQRKDRETRGRVPVPIWRAFWQSVEAFDAGPFLARATLPILEVYGALGRVEDTARRLAVPSRPNIAWRWIERAGHYIPHEAPLDTAQACADGLRAVREGRWISRSCASR
jgi:pimeloyl-ACP methyl ester carboxylesterase